MFSFPLIEPNIAYYGGREFPLTRTSPGHHFPKNKEIYHIPPIHRQEPHPMLTFLQISWRVPRSETQLKLHMKDTIVIKLSRQNPHEQDYGNF